AAILDAHGRRGLDHALKPAIRCAEEGFPVAQRLAWDWAEMVPLLVADPGTRRHYLFGGRSPAGGGVGQLPALGGPRRTLALPGAGAFHEGRIAADVVATLAARGSFLPAEDFARHRGEVVAPIASGYRGLDVLELPPNAQGLIALVLLNILECFDLAALDPTCPQHCHLMLEAPRLAYPVRETHVAEPASIPASLPPLVDNRL